MTKFEELQNIITRNKNKNNGKNSELVNDNVDSLEVAGSESSKTPLLSCGDEEIDGSIVDDLGKLDKEQTSYHNVLDAFRLALKGINLVKKKVESKLYSY